MNKNCLREEEMELYYQYLMGIDLELIDPEELKKIEEHIFNCEDCTKEVYENYQLIQFLNNWSIEDHAQTVKFNELIKKLRNMRNDEIYHSDENFRPLLEKLLSENFNYAGRGFEPFVSERYSKEKIWFKKFLTLKIEKAGEKFDSYHIYNNNDILEDVSVSFENDALKIREKFVRGGEKNNSYFLLLSDNEEEDYLQIKKLKTPEADAEFEEVIFENLKPGTYHLFVEQYE